MLRTTLVSANFTRPNDTTAYANLDLIANSTTAGSVTMMEFANASKGVVKRGRLLKSSTGMTNPGFRLHLFSRGSLTNAAGDNAGLSCNGAANYLGAMDCTIALAFTDGASGVLLPVAANGSQIVIPSNSNIYGLLAATAAYAPGAQEVFTVTLEVESDD